MRARELPFLAVFGIAGLAFVQWFYFLAIHRLALGIALLIQYTAPLLVALWARYAYHEPVRRRIWVALALALAGLALIVNVRGGGRLSTAGVAFAAVAALTYALYVLMAERERRATATRSRCSRGVSCSRPSSGRRSRRGGRSRQAASATRCRCSGTSTRGTPRCGR